VMDEPTVSAGCRRRWAIRSAVNGASGQRGGYALIANHIDLWSRRASHLTSRPFRASCQRAAGQRRGLFLERPAAPLYLMLAFRRGAGAFGLGFGVFLLIVTRDLLVPFRFGPQL